MSYCGRADTKRLRAFCVVLAVAEALAIHILKRFGTLQCSYGFMDLAMNVFRFSKLPSTIQRAGAHGRSNILRVLDQLIHVYEHCRPIPT